MTDFPMNSRSFLTSIIHLVLTGTCGDGNNAEADAVCPVSFANVREVSIVGYNGDAQEPSISRDGNYLFFNNLNSATLPNGDENDTNLHFAMRTDESTFQYMGEIAGANTDNISGTTAEANELEGVASLDKNDKLYYVNTINYLDTESPDYLRSIYQGDFSNGSVLNVSSIPNLKNDRPAGQEPILGELNFDLEVHYDGEILYFVEGIFSGNPFPDEANIGVASNSSGAFVSMPDSGAEMAAVNTDSLEYAPSISTDLLELYFTRAVGSVSTGYNFGIYMATRPSPADNWSNVSRLQNLNGDTVEAPSISFDGKLLYFHKKVEGVFKVYVAERE